MGDFLSVFCSAEGCTGDNQTVAVDAENVHFIKQGPFRVFHDKMYKNAYGRYFDYMPDFSLIHGSKTAGNASEENETTTSCMAFQGTMQVYDKEGKMISETTGSGHHGRDYVGVASIRSGKGVSMGSMMPASMSNVKIM